MSDDASEPTTGPSPDDPLRVTADVESIRTTTKWVMAALGAVATILVAGLNLLDLRDMSDGELAWAAPGAIVALGSVIWALKTAAHVLVRRRFGLHQLASAAEDPRWRTGADFDALPGQSDSLDPVALGDGRTGSSGGSEDPDGGPHVSTAAAPTTTPGGDDGARAPEKKPGSAIVAVWTRLRARAHRADVAVRKVFERRESRRLECELGPIARYIDEQTDLLVYVGPLARVERRRAELIALGNKLSRSLAAEEVRAGKRWKAERDGSGDGSAAGASKVKKRPTKEPAPPARGPDPSADVADLGLSARELELIGLTTDGLAANHWASRLELIGFLKERTKGELASYQQLGQAALGIARLEIVRHRFEHAMRVLLICTITFVLGVGWFAAQLPPHKKEATADEGKAPCVVLMPTGIGGLDLTQEQVDKINEAGNSIDIDQLLAVVEGITKVAATETEAAVTAMEKLGPAIIDALGTNVVKPLIEHWLGGSGGSVDGPPPGWSVVLRVQMQIKLRAQGLDAEVANHLVDLLIEAIEEQIGPDPGANGNGGSSASASGPSVVIINQNDGRVLTVVPDRTG